MKRDILGKIPFGRLHKVCERFLCRVLVMRNSALYDPERADEKMKKKEVGKIPTFRKSDLENVKGTCRTDDGIHLTTLTLKQLTVASVDTC